MLFSQPLYPLIPENNAINFRIWSKLYFKKIMCIIWKQVYANELLNIKIETYLSILQSTEKNSYI